MQIRSPGVFQVRDGEAISIAVTATGTLFGVNFSIDGAGRPLTEGQPLTLTMKKSDARGGSFIPNAKSIDAVLLFNFSGDSGGRYDLNVTGDPGSSVFKDFSKQSGKLPKSTTYTFHIV